MVSNRQMTDSMGQLTTDQIAADTIAAADLAANSVGFSELVKSYTSGTVAINTDASGNGTAAVTFGTAMSAATNRDKVGLRAGETGDTSATSLATTGFTAKISGCSATSSTVTVGWVAFE